MFRTFAIAATTTDAIGAVVAGARAIAGVDTGTIDTGTIDTETAETRSTGLRGVKV